MFTSAAAQEGAPMNPWSAPLPTPAEADAALARYREQHLPLRAMDPRVLRSLWSRAQTAIELERRESPSIEKPVEAMTLADLVATQNSEPISESRRSFLTTGQGVLSLEQAMTTLDSDEPLSLADAIEADSVIRDTHTDAIRYGTPYEIPDLVTQRQIEWEQCQAQNGNLHVTRLVPSATGGVALQRVSKWTPGETMRKISKRITAELRETFGPDAIGDWDTLHERMALLSEGARANAVASTPGAARAYENWAVRQVTRPPFAPERIDHSAYERTGDALLIPKRGRYYLLADLTKRQALRLYGAGAEPVTVILDTHKRPSRRRLSSDPLWSWHHTARDPNELDVTRIDGALPRLIRADG